MLVVLSTGLAYSRCLLNGSHHSPHHQKDGRDRGRCLFGTEIPNLSLPSRSMDGSLRDW